MHLHPRSQCFGAGVRLLLLTARRVKLGRNDFAVDFGTELRFGERAELVASEADGARKLQLSTALAKIDRDTDLAAREATKAARKDHGLDR